MTSKDVNDMTDAEFQEYLEFNKAELQREAARTRKLSNEFWEHMSPKEGPLDGVFTILSLIMLAAMLYGVVYIISLGWHAGA